MLGIDLKKILFSEIRSKLSKVNIEVDEINIVIFINGSSGIMFAYLEGNNVFSEILSNNEISMIQRVFVKKILKQFSKTSNEVVEKIYLKIDLEKNDYDIFLFNENNVKPIKFKL